jgi:hypothetical protein
VFVINYFTLDQQENTTQDFLQHSSIHCVTDTVFKSLPSNGANSSKYTDMDNDILIFDTSKRKHDSQRAKRISDKSTQHEEDEKK